MLRAVRRRRRFGAAPARIAHVAMLAARTARAIPTQTQADVPVEPTSRSCRTTRTAAEPRGPRSGPGPMR